MVDVESHVQSIIDRRYFRTFRFHATTSYVVQHIHKLVFAVFRRIRRKLYRYFVVPILEFYRVVFARYQFTEQQANIWDFKICWSSLNYY